MAYSVSLCPLVVQPAGKVEPRDNAYPNPPTCFVWLVNLLCGEMNVSVGKIKADANNFGRRETPRAFVRGVSF